MNKFFFDIAIAVLLFPIWFTLGIFIIFIILIIDRKPVFYLSERIGERNKKFLMIKFRTLKKNCPLVTSETLKKMNKKFYTKTGSFMKKYKLDELPQFIHVLTRDMSIVGPRPALPSQFNLIKLRKKKNLHVIKPGITGLAQINQIQVKTIIDKVNYERIYKKNYSIILDIKIIFLTLLSYCK